jgi:hypothetical protein
LNLVDCGRCLDSSSFLSSCLTSLSLLVNLSLPFLNILTKADIYRDSDQFEIDLEEMLSCENLETLMVWNEASKFSALHNAICGLLEDFQLIRYELLSVKDPQLLAAVIREADHACGYLLR